jgi:two-component system KDP operon response regulator KdpE
LLAAVDDEVIAHLYHLVQNAGWIVLHETLGRKVWGPEYRHEKRLPRLYITYLRKKI